MTHKQNITAILECFFAGFKEEIIDSACNRILEQELTDDATIKDIFCMGCEYKKQEPCDKCDDCNKISAEAYKQVMRERDIAIQQLNEFGYEFGEKIRTGKWIPVSDRLPEKGEEVLISAYDTYNKRVIISRYQGEQYGFTCDLVISAWMPLPKPYKAERGDKK